MAQQSLDISRSVSRRTPHEPDSMQLVRSALRESRDRMPRVALRRGVRNLPFIALFFCSLLLLEMGAFALMALRSSGFEQPIAIEISDQSSDAQIQSFLQALLHLPQVARVEYVTREKQMQVAHAAFPESAVNMSRNDFRHRAEVSLRSPGSIGSFVRFLERPELTGVISETALRDIVSSSAGRRNAYAPDGVIMQFAWMVVIGALVILLLSVWAFAKRRAHELHRSIRVMKLFGSNMAGMQKDVGAQICAMLITALGLSLIVMGMVTWSNGMSSVRILSVMMMIGSFILCLIALAMTRFAIQRS